MSSVLHSRVILDCLLLHFSFCFPSCFSYYAPLANSELTVNLSFFCWRIELKHLGKAELPGRTPAVNTCVAWQEECSQQMGVLWSRVAGEQSLQFGLQMLQLDTVSTPHCHCVLQLPSELCVLAARSKWHPGLLGNFSCVFAWNSSRTIAG